MKPRKPDTNSLLQWPRLAYVIIGALLGAITMEILRRAGW